MLPVTSAAAGALAVRHLRLPPSATSAFLFPASPPPSRPAPSKISSAVPSPPSLSTSTRSLFCCPPTSTPPCSAGRSSVRCEAASEPSELEQTVYQGVYGPWTVEPSDVREVILYRSGLVTSAASFVIASSAAFLPEGNALGDIIKHNIDYFVVTGAGGLGLSLLLIHIYITPIKRFLQALWLLGAFGSIGSYLTLAQPLNESLVNYVIDKPIALWFVGPLFAALTGLVFKEGLCYGKLEAGILTFIIPGLLLGHMTGLVDNGAKLSLLAVWMALFVVFAARKFQQPIKDDIGDKSIFMFNALPEEEKKALKLEKQLD